MRLPQFQLPRFIGMLKIQFIRTQAYFSMINFVLLLITANNSIHNLPLLVFLSIAGIFIIGIVDFIFILKSELSYNSNQSWRANNPNTEQLYFLALYLDEICSHANLAINKTKLHEQAYLIANTNKTGREPKQKVKI